MVFRLSIPPRLRSALNVSIYGSVVFVGANIYFGSERFYEEILMPSLRWLDPENAHQLSIRLAKYGLVPRMKSINDPALSTTVWNRKFTNPIGLAAGFDKNGEAIDGLSKIGFGFIEIGTITPKPQSGNEKPRVFRLTEDRAIINRYGFNNDGYDAARTHLIEYRERTKNNKENILIGVNIGKNKDTTNAAIERDYTLGVEQFGCLADYLVINVSSPNTQGLRSLQGETELKQLLTSIRTVANKISCEDQSNSGRSKPRIVLKVAPDLDENQIESISKIIQQPATQIDGLIVSNTTVTRSETLINQSRNETGGLSGRPLKEKALETLRRFRHHTKGQIPLIGVGGVETVEDVVERIKAGASLVQIYTSFTYSGPPIVNKLNRQLSKLLKEQKIEHIHDLVGVDDRK